MSTEFKKWTTLGLTAVLAGTTLLTACGGEGEGEGEHGSTAIYGEGEGEGEGEASIAIVAPAVSEGGEGEGGVAVDRAGTDPVVFATSLAIAEAHIIAARDAFAIGKTDAAAEMYAHPVSEVLLDVEYALDQQGVEPMAELFIEASELALNEATTTDDINAKTEAIISALRTAATKAPDDGSSIARIQAGVVADQIDRAAVMYEFAGSSENYEPYLDGYGFYKAAVTAFELESDAIRSEYPDAAAAIEKAFSVFNLAYASVDQPAELDQNPAALKAAASGVVLALSE